MDKNKTFKECFQQKGWYIRYLFSEAVAHTFNGNLCDITEVFQKNQSTQN